MPDQIELMQAKVRELETADADRIFKMQIVATLEKVTLATISSLGDAMEKLHGSEQSLKRVTDILARCQINAEMLGQLLPPATGQSPMGLAPFRLDGFVPAANGGPADPNWARRQLKAAGRG